MIWKFLDREYTDKYWKGLLIAAVQFGVGLVIGIIVGLTY